MDAVHETLPAPTAHSPWRSYLLEARCEFLRLLRTPSFALPSLLFPGLFYVLFGVLLNHGNAQAARYLLASYGVFGVMGAGLFGFGVTVALEREQGFLAYKRALPMPPGAYLLAKMAMAMLFSLLIVLLLAALAAGLAGVRLAPLQWALLVLVEVLGALPFCAIGLYLGTLVGGQGAPAVLNLLYLPMAFASGLWLPLSLLPHAFTAIAPLWPSWHLAQVALVVVDVPAAGAVVTHAAVLLAVTAAFFLLARRRLRHAG